MKPEFDWSAIERVVAAIADELEGEWLLVGGALVALCLEPRRVTEDIDVVGNGPDFRLRLMELMERLELDLQPPGDEPLQRRRERLRHAL